MFAKHQRVLRVRTWRSGSLLSCKETARGLESSTRFVNSTDTRENYVGQQSANPKPFIWTTKVKILP